MRNYPRVLHKKDSLRKRRLAFPAILLYSTSMCDVVEMIRNDELARVLSDRSYMEQLLKSAQK